MDDDASRLSRIETHWNRIAVAHGSNLEDAALARRKLVTRYYRAAYRYLLGAVRDAAVAEELCNDFVLKFMEGAFHRAVPDRGRFRDYIKTCLINMVNSHWREQAKQPVARAEFNSAHTPKPLTDADKAFDQCWREELLDRTWKALRSFRPHYFDVLRARVDEPEMTAAEIAAQLSSDDQSLEPASVRKTLERSRAKYAELLIDEVSIAIGSANSNEIQHELETLDLLRFCRSEWQKRVEKEIAE